MNILLKVMVFITFPQKLVNEVQNTAAESGTVGA